MLPPPPSPIRYRLADHVRACLVDGQVVLLDLQRGKYLGIGGSQAPALAQAIVDWPQGSDGSATPGQASTPAPPLTALLNQGMLADARDADVRRRQIEEPLDSLNVEMLQPPFRWRHLAGLCWSAAMTSRWLRLRSLADIARLVIRLRRGARNPGAPGQCQELLDAVASYTRLRPLVFSAHDQCLHDSLCLVRFLAMEKIAADWVIGVRTRPFGAHSWVQCGSLVLNDLHENVRAYEPILVV